MTNIHLNQLFMLHCPLPPKNSMQISSTVFPNEELRSGLSSCQQLFHTKIVIHENWFRYDSSLLIIVIGFHINEQIFCNLSENDTNRI